MVTGRAKNQPVKMTELWAAREKAPPGGRLEVYDTEVKGLFLRVSETSKVFGYRYRSPLGNGQPRIRLGRYVEAAQAREMADLAGSGEDGDLPLTVAGARVRARRYQSMIDSGRCPATELKDAREAVKAQPLRTIADLAAAYFTACEKGHYRPRKKVKRATTIAGERSLYDLHLKPHFGSVRIEALSRSAIKKPLHALLDEGKGTTANRARALLRQMYSYAIKEGRVDTNPVALVDAPAVEQSRERVLSDPELKALWSALRDPSGLSRTGAGDKALPVRVGRPVRIALQLALLTAQRRGEVSSMRVEDLDFEQNVWTIPAAVAKNGEVHSVPITPKAAELIREALAMRSDPKSRYVFPAREVAKDAPMGASALSHAMADLVAALGFSERATTHDLRRSAASLMGGDRGGVSPGSVGVVLNHKGARGAGNITFIYMRDPMLAEKRRALMVLERVLLEIVGEREPDAKVVSIAGAAA